MEHENGRSRRQFQNLTKKFLLPTRDVNLGRFGQIHAYLCRHTLDHTPKLIDEIELRLFFVLNTDFGVPNVEKWPFFDPVWCDWEGKLSDLYHLCLRSRFFTSKFSPNIFEIIVTPSPKKWATGKFPTKVMYSTQNASLNKLKHSSFRSGLANFFCQVCKI